MKRANEIFSQQCHSHVSNSPNNRRSIIVDEKPVANKPARGLLRAKLTRSINMVLGWLVKAKKFHLAPLGER